MIFKQLLPTRSLRKWMELSLEKLYVDTGVLIKIQVASMYEKSIQLYQQGAISPLFLGGRGSGGVLPQNFLRFQSPKMRFLAFWVLN